MAGLLRYLKPQGVELPWRQNIGLATALPSQRRAAACEDGKEGRGWRRSMFIGQRQAENGKGRKLRR